MLWLAPLLFLSLFFFYPLGRILALTFNINIFTAENLQLAYGVLRFTLYQALLSTFLTLLLGLPSAYLFARFDFRGKSLLRTLTAIPFMLPTVVVAAGFNALLGSRGWINLTLMNSLGLESPPIQFVGTLGAILLAHVFYNTNILIRIVGNALANLDPRLEQAGRSLGADSLHVWRNITFPLLRPSIFAATLLVFLFDFTSFGVILLLGTTKFSTLEVEIFVQLLKLSNLPLAALLSLIQLFCTLVFAILYTHWVRRTSVQTTPRPETKILRRAKKFPQKIFVAGLSSLLLAFFILPLISLPVRSISRLEAERGQRGRVQYGLTTDYYSELFINRRGSVFYVPPIDATRNSLSYAGATVLLSLVLGFPAASALAKPTRLEKLLDPLLILPLGVSAVTLGLGFIVTYGKWLVSPWVVPLAHTLVALPFVIRALQPAIASIPERLRQAASVLGASPFQVWRTVDWPILARATLGAAIFAFTISMGEFGAALLITRPEYPTIPVAIYRFLSQPGGLNYGQAMAMATILMTMTALGILLIEKLRLPGTVEF
jgi:thiamine transport system permease protein